MQKKVACDRCHLLKMFFMCVRWSVFSIDVNLSIHSFILLFPQCWSSSAFLLFFFFVGKVLQTSSTYSNHSNWISVFIVRLSKKPIEDKRDKICLFIDEPMYTHRQTHWKRNISEWIFLVILLSMRERGCKTLQLSIVYHKAWVVYKHLSFDINRRMFFSSSSKSNMMRYEKIQLRRRWE